MFCPRKIIENVFLLCRSYLYAAIQQELILFFNPKSIYDYFFFGVYLLLLYNMYTYFLLKRNHPDLNP